MSDEERINPGHQNQRSFLKVVGPLLLVVGIGFMAVGIISFFSTFGSFGSSPKYFWCCFVGMPIMAVGGVMTKFAYMGKVARYSAAELAPVAKDAFNYLAKESSEGISDIAQTLKKSSSQNGLEDVESRIAKLEELRRKDIINDEDYEEQKDRILSEI